MIREFVRRLPLFAGLSETDLDWLVQQAENASLSAGSVLMEEGSPGGSLYVVLEGEFEITKRSGQQDVVLAVRGAGEVLGEMSLLDNAPRSATVRAIKDSRLLKIDQSAFQRLLSSSPSATLSILHTVTSRLRNTEAMLQQHEKMAALGTLAAGLAHELNNPAAAARRSAAQLRDALTEWQRSWNRLEAAGLGSDHVKVLNDYRQEVSKQASAVPHMRPLELSDREAELQSWLETHGMEQAWEMAPALVASGWDRKALEKSTRGFGGAQLDAAVRWLGASQNIDALLEEVGQGAERISEIVKAVKSYSYLDQAPIQEVDVHEGLENTLIILRHKLKQGVQVTRDYAPNLPRIEAYASELNQVWTNIIDNAIDAMKGEGQLTLRTYPQAGHVVVEIVDSGSGIPTHIQARIFEPFFTTKPPGVGTGLGLHITYNIVVQKHRGQIGVKSQPGETCFQVSLPVQIKREQSESA